MISISRTIISVSQSLVVNSIQGANCLEKVGSTHVVLHVGVPAVIQALLQSGVSWITVTVYILGCHTCSNQYYNLLNILLYLLTYDLKIGAK